MRTVSLVRRGLVAALVIGSLFIFYGFFFTSDYSKSSQPLLKNIAKTVVQYLSALGMPTHPSSEVQDPSRSSTLQESSRSSSLASDELKQSLREKVAQRFAQRRQTFQQACAQYGNSALFRRMNKRGRGLGPFYPVMNASFEYCPIEKIGSTTWKAVFADINKKMKGEGIQKSHDAAEKKIKFIFTREPYSRLLSAYVDKLFSPNSLFWRTTGTYIVSNFRKNASKVSLRCGHDVTFPEFIRYVIHAQKTGEHRDGHFVPTHDRCNMCKTSYDYVGHLETLSEDMPYLLNISHAPYAYTKNFHGTIHKNAGWVLQSMKTRICECMTMEEACLRLWKKWHIRGILSKTEPLPVSAKEAKNISKLDFVKLAEAALQRSGPKEERKRQKTEALREAFASVPIQDKLEIQKLLFLDFALFGFDPQPELVFPTKPEQRENKYSYLDVGVS